MVVVVGDSLFSQNGEDGDEMWNVQGKQALNLLSDLYKCSDKGVEGAGEWSGSSIYLLWFWQRSCGGMEEQVRAGSSLNKPLRLWVDLTCYKS